MQELRAATQQTEQNTANHEQNALSGLQKVRAVLNGNPEVFDRLELLDFQHEERESQKLFLAWVNEDGSYKYTPHQWAVFLSNHVLSLEKWSNHFSVFITIMGVATAMFVLRIKEQPELFATTTLFTFIAAIVKWNIDRQIVLKKKTVNRLNSFPPNKPLNPTPECDAALPGQTSGRAG